MEGRKEESMADENPGTVGPPREGNGSGKANGSAESMENFGPVSSLEPDGVGPLDAGPESAGFRERFSISVTWESVSEGKSAKPTGRAKKAKAEAGKAEGGSAGRRKKSGILNRVRSKGGQSGKGAKEGAAPDPGGMATGPGGPEIPQGAAEAGPGKPGADWTRASRAEPPREAESENDALLLDDAFLKRTFKDVHFPARKELVLRYVDQEQDFIYGKDRTVNLHNLITHLDEDRFPTRRDLMHAIKDRLLHHHH